ncbi:TonB-dependent receptor [Xanthomonas citri pv. citri]|uniref:TonB-dependent receptor n=1 Tax=Xanthomonas citri TaxID=346 RepID=UPI00052DF9A1|nr:TonB-dependent receptor [Xanthomonas citri]PIB20352.1 TonB-dependent receptor [Xanthomonas citri pv. citri]QRD74142.1 TonB-dependent receptor [Xanthomonas citri pv. citri]QRD78540.1 TonB-dependent receptor [Xanthomonas citri pv. citri]CEE53669.1 TonB-dependent receptor [Xanthomonas citri pv. citri]CEH54520.1 TonB-dependent receptor [Xanthomonas citri pv. citri]
MTCTQATLLSLSIAAALGCIGAARAQQTATVQATEATTLDQVVVSGRLRSLEQFTPTGSRLNLSARETPGTLDAINAAAIEARGLRSVEKAAESLPGINTGGSPGNPATFSMRGFTDGQITILHNGLYLGPSNMTNRPQNTFNLQSVEVLKGPASVIYGQGAVGGAVNVTNKAPTFGPAQYELLLGASSYGGRVFGVGAGGGINDDWAYRADISQVSSDGYVHGADSSAINATVSLLWHPREDISAQFSLDYAKDQPSTYFGTPLLPAAAARTPINGILRAPNGEVVDAATRRTNYNVADASIDSRQLWPQAYLKWKVTDAITVQNMAYYFHADRRWINAENYTYNPQSGRIERDRFFVYHEQALWGNQTSATFDQRIAGLKNRLVVGLDYSRLDFVRNRGFPDGDSVAVDARGPSGEFGERVRRRSPTTWTNAALFFEDALDVTDKAKLVLGGRYEYLDLDRKNFGPDGGFQAALSFSRTYRPANGRLGLVYALTPNITPYASYTTATDPVGSNIFIVNAGQDFALSKSRQAEVGVKAATADQRLSGTLAVYDIKRNNILALTAQDALSNIGRQTSRGFELSVDAQLTSQWSANANYAYVDAEYAQFIDSNSGLDASGNRPTNVPKSLFNAWTSVRNVAGLPLELGASVRHVGTRYGNLANTLRLESYTLTGAYATYDMNSEVSLSLHADNLFNTHYVQWADVFYPGQVILGLPRTVELSLHARF